MNKFPVELSPTFHTQLLAFSVAAPQHAHAKRFEVELLTIALNQKALVELTACRGVVVGISNSKSKLHAVAAGSRIVLRPLRRDRPRP